MSEMSIRPLCVLTVALALPALGPSSASAQPSTAQMKADEQSAKALAKEGDELLKAKKFVESRAKYVEALRLQENPKYSMMILRVDHEIDKVIKKRLEEASKLFEAGKHDAAIAKLDETVPLRAADPAVLYNRAVIAHKIGQRKEAVAHLAQALDAGPPDNERIRLLQLKTQWETGEKVQAAPPQSVDTLKDLNEELASGDSAPDTCAKMRALAGSVTKSASLTFNLAKCAEDEGNLEEASRLLGEYLALAPDAIDQKERQSGLDEVRDLEGRAGPKVVALYADADRAAREGHYKRAIDAMLQAAQAAPQVAETHLKLARLYQASDNITEARAHYDKYLGLETREAQLSLVRQEQAALDERAKHFEELVGPARERFLQLIHRYVVEGRPMGVEAARDEARSIADQLQQASVMMPLTRDVQRMLGLIYLSDGNYPAARKAFNVVSQSGSPVWFYAAVQGIEGWDKTVISKVELSGTQMRVVGLARVDKRQQVPLLAAASTPADRVGGLLEPASSTGAKVLEIPADDITAVETDDDFVRVSWAAKAKTQELRITPLRVTSAAPYKGPAARKFANAYTKLFRDFSDKKVKLGAEKLTGGEKFGMVMQVALAAYAGGMMSAASGMQGAANFIAAAMRSATSATMELQNALDAQARMLRSTEFKIIPVEDPKPTFRTELFR
jgi:tetratricopeptide (TPR) repeat protein